MTRALLSAGLLVALGCSDGAQTTAPLKVDPPMANSGSGRSGDLPRVQKTDLVYEGAFRVPSGGSETSTFEFGGTALGIDLEKKSLFMAGHDWHQRTAEVSILPLVNSASLSGLNRASLLQPFKDATEGRLSRINPSDGNAQKIGGHLVYGGKLYVSGYSYYDAGYSQNASHFVRPASLSSSGGVQGPFRLGDSTLSPRWVGGYMTTIPTVWQAQFGGPALTGMAGIPIVSAGSVGPAASVFDPAKIGVSNPAPAVSVLGYPLEQSLTRLAGYGETNPVWNLSSEVRGVVFPDGTRSVLFIGRHGTGRYCYGTGEECGDPVDDSKGNHAYPYVYQVWAYDATDLLLVKEGRKLQHEVLPYAVWTFNLPFEERAGARLIGGAAWDPTTRRIYISQLYGDGAAPVIHALRLAVGGQ